MAGPYNRTVFSELVEKARDSLGLTQDELADRMGVGQQAVSKWETGETRPRPNTLIRLAPLLGLNPELMLIEAGYLPSNGGPGGEPLRAEQSLPDGKTTVLVIDRYEPDVVTDEGSRLPGLPRPQPTVSDDEEAIEQSRPAALSGAAMPDDLTEDERRLVEGFIEGLRARRNSR